MRRRAWPLAILSAARSFPCHRNRTLQASYQLSAHRRYGTVGRLKILSVTKWSGKPGEAPYVLRDVEALRSLGHSVEFYNISQVRRPWHAVKALRQRIARLGPDVLHAHFGDVVGFVCALASLGKATLVITYRGSDLNPSPSHSTVRMFVGHCLSQFAALVAARTICVSSELRDRLWWKTSYCSVLPTGVPTNIFFPRDKLSSRLAVGWMPEEHVVIFNVGERPKEKRLDLAQFAIELARRTSPTIRLALLKGDVLPERVALMMNAADCLLVTSDFEGSPTIVQEAMACGLPIVSVKVGDVVERLANVSPSCIVERDPREIARGLLSMIKSGKRSNGPGLAARELSTASIAVRTAEVLSAAVERPLKSGAQALTCASLKEKSQ